MPSWVSPVTCACSEARRIGLPWPSRTPCRTSTKSRCASIWIRWIGAWSLNARTQGMLIAWSPPRANGMAPRSRILRTAASVLRVAGGGVGMDDVGVAHVDDPDLVHGQVDRVVLVVVGAAMAEGEQGRGLADAARAEAGAGAVLRAHVVGHAEHGDVGVERVPVEAGRPLAERAVPDEGQI